MRQYSKWYFVLMRDKNGLVTEVPVQAENTFMAQRAALSLYPYSRAVKIALAPPDWDGENR